VGLKMNELDTSNAFLRSIKNVVKLTPQNEFHSYKELASGYDKDTKFNVVVLDYHKNFNIVKQRVVIRAEKVISELQ
jgi:hypothetical protein